MHMHREISVPMKGHYWLRDGIHDRIGDRPTPTSTAK
jgi:hypothetical protein